MNKSSKSRSVAFLLSFFLGGFGAHRFYAGKGGSAIAQLLMSLSIILLPVSAIWAFIDMLVIAFGKFKDKENNLITNW